ncbi:MAG: family peptidase, partial [Caulobacter sp.]|nr:family peptidase [Caulobacter sp.]
MAVVSFRFSKRVAVSFIVSLAAAAALQAASAAPQVTVHRHESLALAPAADRFAAVESDELVGSTAEAHGVVTVRSAQGAVIGRFDPCPACRYAGSAWSPDGKALAFVAADAKAGTATLFVIEGDKTRPVTVVQGVAGTPRWSPDGQSIALLATVGARKESGATQAGARQVGEIGVAAAIDEQRIAVVPLAGGPLSFVSPDDTYVYEYAWRPDGRGFVGTAAKGDGDNNWWVASLQAFDRDGGARIIAAPKMQLNAPRVSPDGTRVAFIGGLMSDFGAVGG